MRLITKNYSVRIATSEDFADVLAFSEQREIFTLLLKPQFGTFMTFLSKVDDHSSNSVFCVGVDREGSLAGWACCFRFHERPGYRGARQFIMDVRNSNIAQALRDALYDLCAQNSRNLNARTVISFADHRMGEYYRWHERSGFDRCGAIPVGTCSQLHVFSKALS